MTNHGAMHIKTKLNNNQPFDKLNLTKVLCVLWSKWPPAFRDNWTHHHRCIRATYSDQFQIVHQQLFGTWTNHSPLRQCKLLHINLNKNYIRIQNIDLMGHPPYSFDLVSNDFFLFSQIKHKLPGERFSTPEEAVDAFKSQDLEVPQSV